MLHPNLGVTMLGGKHLDLRKGGREARMLVAGIGGGLGGGLAYHLLAP